MVVILPESMGRRNSRGLMVGPPPGQDGKEGLMLRTDIHEKKRYSYLNPPLELERNTGTLRRAAGRSVRAVLYSLYSRIMSE